MSTPDPHILASPVYAALRRRRTRLMLLGVLGAVWGTAPSYGLAQALADADGPGARTGAPPAPVPSSSVPAASVPAAPTQAAQTGSKLEALRTVLFSRLLSEARNWQSKHQFDRALSSINSALDMEPRNPEALLLLGTIQKASGDLAGAQTTLQRMQNSGLPPSQVNALRAVLEARPIDSEQLAHARALAAEGKTLQASLAYKALFNGAPPPELALEYYGALGSTILGYQEAVTNLQLWQQSHPLDYDAQLLYYRVLTYREPSRAAGLDGLRRLATADITSSVRRQAYAAWRQTLLWEPIRGSSIPLYQEWLTQHPDDTDIADRRQRATQEQKRIDGDDARINGFSQLSAGRVDEAERNFRQALSYNASDASALGGMGLVAQRRHEWHLAQDSFRQAMAADPSTANHWQTALSSIHASMMGSNPLPAQIIHAIETHNYDVARREIAQLGGQPGQQTNALLFRAELELREDHRTEAEEAYRAALMRSPRNAGAMTALVTLLLQDGRVDEAEAALRQSGELRPDLLARIQGARDLRQASLAATSAEKIALLKDAVDATPDDPWVRLKLAQALAADNRPAEGQAVMDTMLKQPRVPREGLAAAIIYADGQNDFVRAQALLSRLPAAELSPDMRQIMERAQLKREVSAAQHDGASAVDGLRALARRPDPSGQQALLVADALLGHGEAQVAYDTLRQGESQAGALTLAQRLNYAGLYLRILGTPGSPALQHEVQNSLRNTLNSFDTMAASQPPTPQERGTRQKIGDGFLAITADGMTQQGRPEAAVAMLKPIVSAHPDAMEARLALARAYEAQDMPDRALAEDVALLRDRPNDTDILAAAIHDATMAGDTATAGDLTRRLVALAPRSRQTWNVMADNAQANGDMRGQLAAMQQVRAIDCANKDTGNCAPQDVNAADYRWPQMDGDYDYRQAILLPDTYHFLPNDTQAQATTRSVVYLRDSISPQVDANAFFRVRTGSAGLGRLNEFGLPITGNLPFNSWNNRLSFSITPTFLFAGNPLARSNSNHQFGQCATQAGGVCAGTGHHADAQGVGLDLAYTRDWFSVDVGSTPLGFPIENVLGGIAFAPHLTRDLVLRINGGREMVTNSELSYAGARDPVTGRTWGGVTRDFGGAMLDWGQDGWNLYAGGSFAYLDGTHVAGNTEVSAQAGGNAVVWNDHHRQQLSTGLGFSYLSYRHNSDLFTWGNGGYFSPQAYYAIMVPVEWSGHQDKWTWLLRGEGGFQHYRAGAATYFLPDDGLHAYAGTPGTQGRQSASGVAGNVRGRVVYQITPRVRLSLQLGYSRAGNWSEFMGFLMAHYTFDGP